VTIEATPRAEPNALTAARGHELEGEHRRFSRHLVGVEPTPYQTAKYVDFHRVNPLGPRGRFDALLLGLSGWGGAGLTLADAYSGTLFRDSLVRSKLTLCLAILECSPPSFVLVDRPGRGGRLVYLTMTARVLVAALALTAAALLLAPLHAFYAVTRRVGD
jgi:hypothetical protein